MSIDVRAREPRAVVARASPDRPLIDAALEIAAVIPTVQHWSAAAVVLGTPGMMTPASWQRAASRRAVVLQ
ncbi:MAG: hypothetical protein KDK91_10310 [Gammaproteobacteria bacterium]|nr:hypothetical protein [Gammaproteobacteria bacterium]